MEVILLPYRIQRRFVIEHREWIFVYSSDYYNHSIFGQAWSVANEPNTYPVPVMYKACCGGKPMCDELWPLHKLLIDERISQIPRDGRPIIPLKKIGEGNSQMKTRAPKLFAYLRNELNKIAYPCIEIDYAGTIYPLFTT